MTDQKLTDVEATLSAGIPATGDGASARAADQFRASAGAEALADVAYAQVDSPLGPLYAAVTRRGLAMLAYGEEDFEVEARLLARLVSPRILRAPRRVDPVRRQLEEYFEGRRRRFEVPIDWSLVRGFGRDVLAATAAIPYGQVLTYREVASVAHRPLAARAAGNALGANPIPIVVPCHRVVHSGGGLGGYTGGLDRKRFLLRLEGVSA